MFTAYRRHEKTCKYASRGRNHFRCGCPIYADDCSHDSRERIRKSLGTRDWEQALATVLEWNKAGVPCETSEPLSVEAAIEIFKKSMTVRNLKSDTISKYELMFKGLRAFAAERNIKHIAGLTKEAMHEFRATWPEKNLTAQKKLDRLKAFGNFAVEIGWLPSSPAAGMKSPRIRQAPTMPYTDDQMKAIVEAATDMIHEARPCARHNLLRVRSLVLLLRYSGLRIGDATACSVEQLVDKRLRVYTQKTGQHVHIVLPDFVIRALETTPRKSERFWFWSGHGQIKTQIKNWQRFLVDLGERAKVSDFHAHRFRDTFAVKLLLDGTPLERVSILLGHSSIKVTEKHYSPWIQARQEQAEADVRRSWQCDPLFLMESTAVGGAKAKLQ